jgi:SNF2 family DNA or RNA helicase
MSELWVPHCYQRTAISEIISNEILGLFLDPGLGKTSIALCAIKILKYNGSFGNLVIVPINPMYNTWPLEISKWTNFNNLTHTILHGKTKDTLWGPKKDIYLINPEGLKWLYYELLKGLKEGRKLPFKNLWVDESTKFKNDTAKRFDLLCDMLCLFKRRHILTGTPAPKSLLNLWSQMYILMDEKNPLGGNYYDYRSEYFFTEDWDSYNYQLIDFCDDIIKEKIAPYVLEMSAEDHLDMPPLVYNPIYITLPDKAYKYYKQMERQMWLEIDQFCATAEAAVQATQKCHQISNGRVYADQPEGLERPLRAAERDVLQVHTAKLEALEALIDELGGKPLLVTYYYNHDLAALQGLLGAALPYIGRGTKQRDKEKYQEEFNKGNIPILAVHPDSAALGLNLQGKSTDICFYSLFNNTENYIQIIRRLWRQGVGGKVRAHHLIAKGTVDEAIYHRLGQNCQQQIDFRKALKLYRESNL